MGQPVAYYCWNCLKVFETPVYGVNSELCNECEEELPALADPKNSATLTSTVNIFIFGDSPDVGPDCPCSLCTLPILDFAFRIWPVTDKPEQTLEARFHKKCFDDFNLLFKAASSISWIIKQDLATCSGCGKTLKSPPAEDGKPRYCIDCFKKQGGMIV